MSLTFTQTAIGVIARTMAAIFRPPANITPTDWGAKNLKVPDGPRAGELWSPDLTPYIVEPLDNMGPASPVNKQVIRKSAQTGFTVMAIVGVGHSIDCDPAGGLMVVQPTQDALDKFLRDKFNPAVEDSPALKKKVYPQVARSGEGSTAYNKRYPGGSASFVIANSTASLRSITKKRRIKDEASEYPDDLDGQGSPHAMIEARGESFLADGEWKETNISTPTILGACYIDGEFKKGDQRYWHVDCPGCGDPLRFIFGLHFKFDEDQFPLNARYIADCCGTVIEGHQKNELVRRGSKHAPPRDDGRPNGWIATAPGPGKFPSYHFDTLSSPFVPWDVIAARYIDARSNPAMLKAFYNLTLAEAYEMKGDAPDHERLFERREDYRQGHIPPRGLMLTGYADVQLRGIYYEIVAWGPNRESWVVDAGVIAGDTTDHRDGAFAELDAIYRREYPDAFGGRRSVDAFGVDSGFRSHVVYAWCAERHKAFATKGVDGWSRPALGMPTLQDIDLGGRKIAQGVKLWPVGNWSLKGHWYEDLKRPMTADGVFPPGYVHFGKFLDLDYFKQITAEVLLDKRHRGRVTKAWEPIGNRDNHFLDCRIGNMALADHLGLSRMTEEEWKVLARERAAPLLEQGDLFSPRPLAISAAAVAVSAASERPESEEPPSPTPAAAAASSPAETLQTDAPPPPPAPPKPEADVAPARLTSPPAEMAPGDGGDWIGRDTSGWLNR